MKNFYIIGMPRCRSLWLAHLLTQGECFCYHERLSGTNHMFTPTLPDGAFAGQTIIGSADTFPGGFNEKLVGDSPVVVIRRHYFDVRESIIKNFHVELTSELDNKLFEQFELLNTIKTKNTMIVDFNDLSKLAVVLDIMKHVGCAVKIPHVSRMMESVITVKNTDISRSNHAFSEWV